MVTMYCDEEIKLDSVVTGIQLPHPDPKLPARMTHGCPPLPDVAVSILAEYSCEFLADQLVFSLLSTQYRRVMLHKYNSIQHRISSRDSGFAPGGYTTFNLDSLSEYFVNWSQIRFGGSPKFITDASKDVLSFYCKSCYSLIITQNEVDSPHYHGGYGPAFLANFVYNCHHSPDEAYETQFTTGVYRVCDVTCIKCSARVGKKYIEARDPANFFKVGKILLEQTLLVMPKCCNMRRVKTFPPDHYFCARDTGVSSFCSICFDSLKLTVTSTVLAMTRNFNYHQTTKLLSLILAERSIISPVDNTIMLSSSSPRSPEFAGTSSSNDFDSPVSSPNSYPKSSDSFSDETPSISRRVSDAISRFISPRPCSSSSSSASSLNIVVNPNTVAMNVPISPSSSSSLSSGNNNYPTDQHTLSRLVGSRIALIPDCQYWIACMKFVAELVTQSISKASVPQTISPAIPPLSSSAIIESLVANCESISFHSGTLLLSRLDTFHDRKAVLVGIQKNPNSQLTMEELNSLINIVGGESSWSAPSSSPTSGSSSSRWSRSL